MNEIDQLRDLLNLNDRQPAMVTLNTSHDATGDVAFVFVGPKHRLQGERMGSAADGSIVYEIRVRPLETKGN